MLDIHLMCHLKYSMYKLIFIALLGVAVLSSCKIFRKKSSDSEVVQTRDSLGVINTNLNLSKLFVLTTDDEVLEIDANGFSRVRVSKDGAVEADGDGKGSLSVKKKSSGSKLLNASDSTNSTLQIGAIKDSLKEAEKKDYNYNATPSTGFNYLWTLILGSLLLAFVYLWFSKFDLKKIFSKIIK